MDPLSTIAAIELICRIGSNVLQIHELQNLASRLRELLEAISVYPNHVFDRPIIASQLEELNSTLSEVVLVLRKYEDLEAPGKTRSLRKLTWAIRDKERLQSMRARLETQISTIGVLLNMEAQRSVQQRESHVLEQLQDSHVLEPIFKGEIIIAVMGETGSGKSSFIQKVTGSESSVKIGHSLNSETSTVEAYSISVDGRVITLVDTPGFDDTSKADIDVLQVVSSWLAESYESRRLLSGIIYLHPITSTRMRGSAQKSLDVFAKLVGPDSFHNITLVTSMWDLLADSDVEYGCVTARSYGDRQSALAIVKHVAFGGSAGLTSGAPVAIQKELVDERRTLEETSAGEVLMRRMDTLERLYQEKLSALTHVLEQSQAQARKDKELMQSEIDRLRKGQISLHEEQLKMKNQPVDSAQKKVDLAAHTHRPDLCVEIGINELLEADLPPPYSPRASWWMADFVEASFDITAFALTPVIELDRLLRPMAMKMLRPQPQKDHSRIEWTCRCGDILYGDYIERKPGSLKSLAAELGGRVVSGPALHQAPASSSGPPPQLSPQAHLQGTAAVGSSTGSTGHPGTPTQQSRVNPDPALAGGWNVAAMQHFPTVTSWLELCIRSSADISILAEIDITRAQTDQSMFEAIRQAYQTNKLSARLLGRFAYRIPNGGCSVMFRKDKLASMNGSPPTVSIMKRQCMPDSTDAQRYHYSFDPVPMDEPAIDSRTFHHYLQNSHSADPSQAWMKRFPQLNDASLYYKPEKLAKGWGMEITEDRNWSLFVIANLISLFMSGTAAGLYAHFMKDNQTGVAIGAWLTAVQTLVVTAVFWRWTA